MTQTTNTNAVGTTLANTHKTSPATGKRRMAREPGPNDPASDPSAERKNATAHEGPRGPSKISSVIALLERPAGATLAELVEATGWLPHTTRAALTGLKKKGHVLAKDKRNHVTCYRIAAAG